MDIKQKWIGLKRLFKKGESTYTKQGNEEALKESAQKLVSTQKKETTFESTPKPKTEKYIRKLFRKGLDSIKIIGARLYGPIHTHPQKKELYKFLADLSMTGIVCSFVTWCFGANFPLRKGFGIAVTITMIQYYLKWYWNNKK